MGVEVRDPSEKPRQRTYEVTIAVPLLLRRADFAYWPQTLVCPVNTQDPGTAMAK
jgi:hypothetical protein